MAISPYIAKLRKKIGHDLLLLPAVTAFILDDQNRVLLHRSSDDGRWYTIGGAVDPGEEPGPACVREVREETGLIVTIDCIVAVGTSPVITYPNRDVCQYVSTAFLCNVIGGSLKISEESQELRYFADQALDALDLLPYQLKRLRHVLSGRRDPLFIR
ncbi:MAG TPA: NUDIX domain-containing protein [Tepidisphaeraceae bacterium]|jgi:8-oxo-dGTP diphosphatase